MKYLLFLLAALCAQALSTPARAGPVLDQIALEVEVEGVLAVGEFLGPPNYGEDPATDRRETAYFLQLPAPMSTQRPVQAHAIEALNGGPDGYFVQLVDVGKVRVQELVGKKVRVGGSAYAAMTGHDRTSLVVSVRSLTAIKDWEWE